MGACDARRELMRAAKPFRPDGNRAVWEPGVWCPSACSGMAKLQVARLFHAHRGNLRDVLRSLYDLAADC